MDIRDVQSRSIDRDGEFGGTRGAGQSPAARNASDRSDDRVTRSARTHAFQETRRAAPAGPEVRSERVDAVREQLADGTLAVDQQRIARELLEQGIVRF
ncbi:MAG: flagellar biosynthesis anti-sigma factor FlgM [Candidatus Rokuibacteriota bacterium]